MIRRFILIIGLGANLSGEAVQNSSSSPSPLISGIVSDRYGREAFVAGSLWCLNSFAKLCSQYWKKKTATLENDSLGVTGEKIPEALMAQLQKYVRLAMDNPRLFLEITEQGIAQVSGINTYPWDAVAFEERDVVGSAEYLVHLFLADIHKSGFYLARSFIVQGGRTSHEIALSFQSSLACLAAAA